MNARTTGPFFGYDNTRSVDDPPIQARTTIGRAAVSVSPGTHKKMHRTHRRMGQHSVFLTGTVPTRETVGWTPGCACGAPAIRAVVLDPFAGSGTTAATALRLGRSSISLELSPDYVQLIHQRLAGVTLPLGFVDPRLVDAS